MQQGSSSSAFPQCCVHACLSGKGHFPRAISHLSRHAGSTMDRENAENHRGKRRQRMREEQPSGSGLDQVEFGVPARSTQPGGHWLKISNLDEVF